MAVGKETEKGAGDEGRRSALALYEDIEAEHMAWCERPFPWRRQLDDLAAEPGSPACIALTGGEPLLMADEAVAFFSRASELFPAAHLRLYTSGDLLSRELIDRLVRAGLHEIRFSVKQDDKPELLEKVLEQEFY